MPGRPAGLFQPPSDARLAQVIRRHLHLDAVADGQAHPALAHLSADGRQHEVLVVELDAKQRAGQHGRDATFHFNVFFFHAAGRGLGKNEKAGSGSPEPRRAEEKDFSSAGRHRRRRRIHDVRRHRRRHPGGLRADGRH